MDSNPVTKDFVEDFDKRTRGLRFSFVQTQCPWIARLRVCLDIAYLLKTENLLLKTL